MTPVDPIYDALNKRVNEVERKVNELWQQNELAKYNAEKEAQPVILMTDSISASTAALTHTDNSSQMYGYYNTMEDRLGYMGWWVYVHKGLYTFQLLGARFTNGTHYGFMSVDDIQISNQFDWYGASAYNIWHTQQNVEIKSSGMHWIKVHVNGGDTTLDRIRLTALLLTPS